MDDLNAASLDDVKEWFRTYYGAANAVIVLAGDITPAEARKKVEQYFGDIPSGPTIKRQQAWVAKMSGEKRAMLQDRVPQARLYKTWNIPGFNTRDYTLLDFASDLLGSGKNSRLYKRLVYKDQIATSVSVGVGPFEIGSQFQITVDGEAGRRYPRRSRRCSTRNWRSSCAPARRLRSWSAYARRAYAELRARPGAHRWRGRQVVHPRAERGVRRLAGLLQAAAAVGAGSRRRRTFRPRRSSWLSDGVFVVDVDADASSTTWRPPGADRSKLPAVGTPPDLKLPPLQRTTLSNGLKVVLAERHNAPVVDMTLIFDAGYAADSLATPGTAKLALDDARRGHEEPATRCRSLSGPRCSARASAGARRSIRRTSA